MKYKDLSDAEIKFIIENYNKLNYEQIGKELNISKTKICYHIKKMIDNKILISRSKRYTWTLDEENILLNLINKKTIIEIANILNKRPEQLVSKLKSFKRQGKIDKSYIISIPIKNDYCGVKITSWTNKDIDKLKANICKKGLISLSKILKKDTYDIILKYHQLKNSGEEIIVHNKSNCKDYTEWSEYEDIYLVKHFSTNSYLDLIKNLNNKKYYQIKIRAKKFGLKKDNNSPEYITYNEQIIKDILEELKARYIFQKKIEYNNNKFYIADFLINDNIIIEAQGDYWHCNPNIYSKPNNTQIKRIAHDITRKETLEKLGYVVVYIWEYDLFNNYHKCFNLIEKLCSHKIP